MATGTVFIPDDLPDLRPCVRNRWGTGVDALQSMQRARVLSVCGDGGDGCYAAVIEFPPSAASLKLVHVSGSGQVQASVVVQPPIVVSFMNATVVPAPGGHCILVFAPTAFGAALLAQRFDAMCLPQWPQAVRLLPSAGGFNGMDAISDGAGGAIVAVNSGNANNGSGRNVLAQRVSAAGALGWGTNGVSLSGAPSPGGRAQLSLCLTADRVAAIWMDPNPFGPSDITGTWLDLNGTLTAGPFAIGVGVDFRHDAAPRRVVADPAGAVYVAFSPDPVNVPLVVQRFEKDSAAPAWSRSVLALSHPMAYSLAADGAGGFLIATVEQNGTVSVDKVDANNFSLWRFTSARRIATVPVAVLANLPVFNHARLVTVSPRDKGGAMVTFQDHSGETPRLMSWCCDEKGAAASSGAIVPASGGSGRQSDALAIASGNDTSIVVWQESSGVSGTLVGAQKLGCCPPNVPPGRLLEPPPPFDCAIPIGFPWEPGGGRFGLPVGGLRLLLTCGGRGWRGGLLPLPWLYGQPGIALPGSLGARGVPAPDWTRLSFRNLPPDTRVELFTHKGEKVGAAKLQREGDGTPLQTLEFKPSAKRSYLLVFVVKGKQLDAVDVPVGLQVEAGNGKPPVFDGPTFDVPVKPRKGEKSKGGVAVTEAKRSRKRKA